MVAAFHACVLALTGFAAASDIRTRIIPNRIPAAIVALFLPAALAGVMPSWPGHLAVFAIAFAVCFALFAGKLMGGGDAKLIPAVALWVGPEGMPLFLIAMTLFGGLLALVLMVRARLRAPVEGTAAPENRPTLPYGVAIAAGGLAVLAEPIVNAFRASFSHVLR